MFIPKNAFGFLLGLSGLVFSFAGIKILGVDRDLIGLLPLSLASFALVGIYFLWRKNRRVTCKRSSKIDDVNSAEQCVINHLKFSATLSLHTPLRVLEHHGKVHGGPLDMLPFSCDREDGMWLPVTKSWAELAGPNVSEKVRKALSVEVRVTPEMIKEKLRAKGWSEKRLSTINELTLSGIQSDVGLVPENGAEYLEFLKLFRSIVESPEDRETKRVRLDKLVEVKKFKPYAQTHGDRLKKWPL